MTENNKYSFLGLWTKVNNLETAKEAASLAGIIAAFLAGTYLAIGLFYMRGVYINLPPPSDDIDFYSTIIVVIVFTVLLSYYARKVYLKISLSAVPYITFWFFLEMLLGPPLLANPVIYILLKIVLSIILINAFIGWLNIKKSSLP